MGRCCWAPRHTARATSRCARDVNLQRWLARGGPPSRLSFTAHGSVSGDSITPPTGAVAATLAPSLFAGTVIDSGAAGVHFGDRRFWVDSLRLQQPGLLTRGNGSLGWKRPDHGTLSLDFDADSLSVLDSLVTWLAGPALTGPTPEDALRGSAQVRLTLEGAVDSAAIAADARVANPSWRRRKLPARDGPSSHKPGAHAPVQAGAPIHL